MTDIHGKFSDIYKNAYWKSKESSSGSGSEIEQAETLVQYLGWFIVKENIQSIVDCPCGDMTWQTLLVSAVKRYVGCDIVPELINDNIVRLIETANPKPTNLGFRVLDITKDPIPDCDLLMVRDCLNHLPNEQVLEAIQNIVRSGAKWVGITTFPNRTDGNTDIEVGKWRPINLQRPPFNMPFPNHIFIEQCTEAEGHYRDKSMAVWNVEMLRDLMNLPEYDVKD